MNGYSVAEELLPLCECAFPKFRIRNIWQCSDRFHFTFIFSVSVINKILLWLYIRSWLLDKDYDFL